MNIQMGNYNKQFSIKVIKMQCHKVKKFFHLPYRKNQAVQFRVLFYLR